MKTITDKPLALIASFVAYATFAFAQTGPPTVTNVTDLQGRTTAVAAGDVVIVSGSNLATTSGKGQPANLSVTVAGKRGVILLYRPNQLELNIPSDLAPGRHPLIVERAGAQSQAFSLDVRAAAPNLLTIDWSRNGPGMIYPLNDVPNLRLGGAFFFEQEIRYRRNSPQLPANPGEVMYVMATGLGVTEPLVPTGQFPSTAARVVAPVSLSAGGKQMLQVTAQLDPEAAYPAWREIHQFEAIRGWFRVYFTVPKDMPEGTHNLTLTAGGTTSNAVQFVVGKPRPAIHMVRSSANNSASIVPGALISLYGINFGQTGGAGGFSNYLVEGISVTLDGKALPILGYYAESNQINVLIPSSVEPLKISKLVVKTPTGAAEEYPVYLANYHPQMFRLSDPTNARRSYAIATEVNTAWLTIPATVATAMNLPVDCKAKEIAPAAYCGAPAQRGSIIAVYATGLGLATSTGTAQGAHLGDGEIAAVNGSPLYQVVAPTTVRIGGKSADVLFKGLVPGYAGLYVLNVRVPADAPSGDAVEISVSMPGVGFPVVDSALIAVE